MYQEPSTVITLRGLAESCDLGSRLESQGPILWNSVPSSEFRNWLVLSLGLLLLSLCQGLLCVSVWFGPHLHAPLGPSTRCFSGSSWQPLCDWLGLLSSVLCSHMTKASPDAGQPSGRGALFSSLLCAQLMAKFWWGGSTGIWVWPSKGSSLSCILKCWTGSHGPHVPPFCCPCLGLSCFDCALRNNCYYTLLLTLHIALAGWCKDNGATLPWRHLPMPLLSSAHCPPRSLTADAAPVVPAPLTQMLG